MNYSQFIKWFQGSKKRYPDKNIEFGSDEWFINRVYNLMIAGKFVDAIVCLENIDDVFRREFVMCEVLAAK